MFATQDSIGYVSSRDKEVFSYVWLLLNFLSSVHKKSDKKVRDLIWPNCHSMCRALRIHLGELVTVVDGFITGRMQFEIIDLAGTIHHKGNDCAINHSWLLLPDEARVDPFPAGVFAMSPLLFPPFGKYVDIYPETVYVPSEGGCAWAKDDIVWERATRLAQVLAFYPIAF